MSPFHLTSTGALQPCHNCHTITQESPFFFFLSLSLCFPTGNGKRLILPNLYWLIKDTESDCLSLAECSQSPRNIRDLFWILVQKTRGKHPVHPSLLSLLVCVPLTRCWREQDSYLQLCHSLLGEGFFSGRRFSRGFNDACQFCSHKNGSNVIIYTSRPWLPVILLGFRGIILSSWVVW